MAVYLFSWDPTKWDWRNIGEQAEQLARGAPVVRQWSCGSNRRIFNGDIAWFIRQGREPRGIFARGEIVRGSYEAQNVDVQDANRGRNTLVVDIRFTAIENAVTRVVLPRAELKGDVFGKFVWDIRESGTKIPDAVAAALEAAWDAAAGKPAGKPASKPVKAAATAKAESAPATVAEPVAMDSTAGDEQERLKQEREARLEKIRQREAAERRKRENADRAPAPHEPLSQERRFEVLVQNYFIMLDAELQGELYSKADHRNRILKELGEADADRIDREHRHISAVLAETGLPFADGFPPEGGYSDALETAVQVFIEANPDVVEALWIDAVSPAAGIPVELDDARTHWVSAPEPSAFRPSGGPAWHPTGVNEIDYRVRESRNRNLEIAGERFVLAFERARLRDAGMKDSIEKVSWQSQTFGESFGYDIRSLEDDGSERFICVKTTNYGARFPFVLTHREMERARQHPARFHVYRVFHFSRNAKLFLLSGNALLQETLEPVAFRSWI
ncbi:MAG TPA: DUF3883 domain-containing protein [Gammaproteobacteria bacterium]